MTKSIYKKIINDFQFLNLYGYNDYKLLKHNVFPSVLFEKENSSIAIGMNYENNNIYVILYIPKNQIHGINIINNKYYNKKKYSEQLNDVKKILIEYLETIK